MKPALLIIFLFSMLGSGASARIGESPLRCVDRHGRILGGKRAFHGNIWTRTHHRTEFFRIILEYGATAEDNRAHSITYIKHDGRDGFAILSEEEIASYLNANGQGRTWKEVKVPKSNHGPTRKWVTTDKTMEAITLDPDELRISLVEPKKP